MKTPIRVNSETSGFFATTLLTLLTTLLGLVTGSTAIGASGIGGSGGGPRVHAAAAVGQTVTVQVCDGGESGEICRQVTYRVRPESKAEPVKCMVWHGEAAEVPCPKNYGVPNWVKRLNESFGSKAETTASAGSTDSAGAP